MKVRLRLGEELLPSLHTDECCPCGRSDASGAHSLVCRTLWKTVVARHSMILKAWRCMLS